MNERSGLVLLNKPGGITSFQALHTIKKCLNIKKVGHAGTLDKFAQGLVLVLTGNLTKMAHYLTRLDKEYEAVFTFGQETDTLDPHGKVIATAALPDEALLREKAKQFTGRILQVPPGYSAVHVRGKRAYKRVMAGENLELEPRPIDIYALEISRYSAPLLRVRVRCSKGTYVRALARDLGRACGSKAYVSELKRTKIGPFTWKEAVLPEEFDPCVHLISAFTFIRQLPSVSMLTVQDKYLALLLHGRTPQVHWFSEPLKSEGSYAVFSQKKLLVALLELTQGGIRYKFTVSRADGGLEEHNRK